jgi:hypothetical protein
MPLVLANRVQETATANTTVSFTLTGAVLGFQTFAVIGDTNTTYYSATDTTGQWEVGLGTYSTTGPTLTRTTIYASSNSNTAVTFSGTVNVFVTYPSGRSVNLDGSGNVSALGTVASGTWQGSTIGVAYGGTGVTSSSGANSVVLRDSNSNITVNRVNQANTNTTAAGGTTTLTAASSYIHTLVGTGGQTYALPDATTLTTGVAFVFNNLATSTLTITDYATATIGTIPSGGAGAVFLTNNGTTGGTWDVHAYLPEGVTFGTNAFNLGPAVISGGTWQGGTIQSGYGGTGLTTFVGANNALYSTGATTLTAGTLPVAAGGTGLSTYTVNGVLYASSATTLANGSAMTFDGTSLTLANDAFVRGLRLGRGAATTTTNILLGTDSLLSGSNSNNVAIGDSALRYGAAGNQNISIGTGTLSGPSSSPIGGKYDNIAVGVTALESLDNGYQNVAVGTNALRYTGASADSNVAIGHFSGYLQTGNQNTFIGAWTAASANGTGGSNTYIGAYAGSSSTSFGNTLIGNGSGSLISTGNSNTIIGRYNGNQNNLDISTASNRVVISDGSGNRILSGGNSLSVALGNNASPQSGTGITFPATQSSSSNVNTLDDYEEGTWTPNVFGGTITGSGTYSYRNGYYTKVGNVVHATCLFYLTSHNGSGEMRVGGFPFASANLTNYNATGPVSRADGLAYVAYYQLAANMTANQTYVTFNQFFTNAAPSNINIDSVYIVAFSITYHTST